MKFIMALVQKFWYTEKEEEEAIRLDRMHRIKFDSTHIRCRFWCRFWYRSDAVSDDVQRYVKKQT